MSYQPEDRYWTDYLRIALPIAGLLLLLGVFWYWASSFIGDDNDDPQLTQIAVVETPISASTQTPTVSAAVTLEPAQTVAPTQESAQPTTDAAAPTATTGTAENGGSTGSGFTEGQKVVVNDNDVNLRATSSTDSEILAILMDGDELSINSSESVDDGTYVWWNVTMTDGTEGWVVGDFIEASDS